MGIKSNHNPKFGTELIKTYPKIPDTSKYQLSEINIQPIPIPIPILQHPIITYKIILPDINVTCN